MDELCEQADIKSMLQEELQNLAAGLGEKPFRAKQLFHGFMRSGWKDMRK